MSAIFFWIYWKYPKTFTTIVSLNVICLYLTGRVDVVSELLSRISPPMLKENRKLRTYLKENVTWFIFYLHLGNREMFLVSCDLFGEWWIFWNQSWRDNVARENLLVSLKELFKPLTINILTNLPIQPGLVASGNTTPVTGRALSLRFELISVFHRTLCSQHGKLGHTPQTCHVPMFSWHMFPSCYLKPPVLSLAQCNAAYLFCWSSYECAEATSDSAEMAVNHTDNLRIPLLCV